jgi:hypothetical protein
MKTFFVDESGDLGAKGKYFAIVLLAPQNSKRISNFMRKFCAANRLDEVKGSNLNFTQKQEVLLKLCSANDYTVSYIVADKENIDTRIFCDKNLCYNYLLSFLVKKTIKSTSEDITIMLDNHSTKVKSINSLADYIKIKAYTQWNFKYNLSICYVDSKASKIIQATDVVANAIYAKYTYGKTHFYGMLTVSESIRFPNARFSLTAPVDKQT